MPVFEGTPTFSAPAPGEPIGGFDVETLTELRREFVATLDVSKVMPPETQRRAIAMADELAKGAAGWQRDGDPTRRARGRLGGVAMGPQRRQPRSLRVVLGGPVRYLGVNVQRRFADGQCVGVRKWHMDIEDRNTMKIIVYLSDVDLGSGPFEYLSRDATKRAVKAMRDSSGPSKMIS